MKVGAVVSDLMLYSRIDSAASAAGASVIRVDAPSQLPDGLDLVLVDWSDRHNDWAEALAVASGRVILFGRHTDLEAHAAARVAGLSPMWARSKLIKELRVLVSDYGTARAEP